jgi:hypothetical protein
VPRRGHEIRWLVDAATAADALEQLPYFLAQRATVAAIAAIAIP